MLDIFQTLFKLSLFISDSARLPQTQSDGTSAFDLLADFSFDLTGILKM